MSWWEFRGFWGDFAKVSAFQDFGFVGIALSGKLCGRLKSSLRTAGQLFSLSRLRGARVGAGAVAVISTSGGQAVLQTATPAPTLPRAEGAGEGVRCAVGCSVSDGLSGFWFRWDCAFRQPVRPSEKQPESGCGNCFPSPFCGGVSLVRDGVGGFKNGIPA